MRHLHCFVRLVTLGLLLGYVGQVRAEVINPTDARGIRELPGQQPFLLNFLSINHSIEDRSVIEFNVARFSGPVVTATLDLDLRNLDPGMPGVIDVFIFSGTGTVTPNLFSAGMLFTSFTNDASGLEHVEVTAAVQAAQQAGEQFLGFRLSTPTSDRFLLGPPFTQAGPTLSATIIPEPGTLTSCALGVLALLGYGLRRKRPEGRHGSFSVNAL